MHDVYREHLDLAVTLHKDKRFDEAEKIYNHLLNVMPFEENLNFLLSDLYLRKDYDGLAINLLSNLLQNNPQHFAAWVNLGCAFRKQNEFDRAKSAWLKALGIGPLTVELCNNFATLYADRARPLMALEWLGKALQMDPECAQSHWGRALALLTLERWDEGWKEYEWRQKIETWDSRSSVEVPMWDGKPVQKLYVHGEQGVGDEIMFSSALHNVFDKAQEITVEVNPKVAGIVKQTWPNLRVVKEATPGRYDAKIPIGSLIGMFGVNRKPYLKPHAEKVAFYRRELEKLGNGPYVALAWFGGAKQTRAHDRSLKLEEFGPLMDRFTCVSAQYNDSNPYVEREREKQGLRKINDESCGGDLHDQAALFKAVDFVVTVQQTAVHVAGGVGAKTHALIGARPHWRYGLKSDSLPWYSSVRLHRRKEDAPDWQQPIQEALNAIDLACVQRAEPRIA